MIERRRFRLDGGLFVLTVSMLLGAHPALPEGAALAADAEAPTRRPGLAADPGAQERRVPFDSGAWAPLFEVSTIAGKAAAKLRGQADETAWLQDTDLAQGELSVDFYYQPKSVSTDAADGSVALTFHGQSPKDYEKVYVRLGDSGLTEAVQYMPVVRGIGSWRLYQPQQGAATFRSGWNRFTVRFQPGALAAYVNDMARPVLTVSPLRNDRKGGMIGVSASGKARIAGFRYRTTLAKPLAVAAMTGPSEAIAQGWVVAPLPGVTLSQPLTALASVDESAMKRVPVEVDGLLNLMRWRALAESLPSATTALARVRVRSDKQRNRIVRLGYYKRAQVFVNGSSLGWFELPSRGVDFDGSTDGWVRLSRRNPLTLPLREGINDIVVLSEAEGAGRYDNWGVFLRFDDMKGLSWVE